LHGDGRSSEGAADGACCPRSPSCPAQGSVRVGLLTAEGAGRKPRWSCTICVCPFNAVGAVAQLLGSRLQRHHERSVRRRQVSFLQPPWAAACNFPHEGSVSRRHCSEDLCACQWRTRTRREPDAHEHAIDRTESNSSARRSVRVCRPPAVTPPPVPRSGRSTPEDTMLVIRPGGVHRLRQKLDGKHTDGLPPALPPRRPRVKAWVSLSQDEDDQQSTSYGSQRSNGSLSEPNDSAVADSGPAISVRAMVQREVVDSHVKLPDGSIPRSSTPRNCPMPCTPRNFIAVTPRGRAQTSNGRNEDLPSVPHTGHGVCRQKLPIDRPVEILEPITCQALWNPVETSPGVQWHVWPNAWRRSASSGRGAQFHEDDRGSAGLIGPATEPRWDLGSRLSSGGCLQARASSLNTRRSDTEEEAMSTCSTPFSTISSHTSVKSAESGAQLASAPITRTIPTCRVLQRPGARTHAGVPASAVIVPLEEKATPRTAPRKLASSPLPTTVDNVKTDVKNCFRSRAGLIATTFIRLAPAESDGSLQSVRTVASSELHVRLLSQDLRAGQKHDSNPTLPASPQVLWRDGANVSVHGQNATSTASGSQPAGAVLRSFSALKSFLKNTQQEKTGQWKAKKGGADRAHDEEVVVYTGDFTASFSSLRSLIQAEDPPSHTTRSSTTSTDTPTPRTIGSLPSSASATPRPSVGAPTLRQGQLLTPRVIRTRPPSSTQFENQDRGTDGGSAWTTVHAADTHGQPPVMFAPPQKAPQGSMVRSGAGERDAVEETVAGVSAAAYARRLRASPHLVGVPNRSRLAAAASKPARDEMLHFVQTHSEEEIYLC